METEIIPQSNNSAQPQPNTAITHFISPKNIIIVVAMIIFIISIGLILLKPWQTKIPVLTQKPAEQIVKPTRAIPQTNPFEVKTNPFKDVKINPFR